MIHKNLTKILFVVFAAHGLRVRDLMEQSDRSASIADQSRWKFERYGQSSRPGMKNIAALLLALSSAGSPSLARSRPGLSTGTSHGLSGSGPHPLRGILGPPAHFDGLEVGTQYLSASRECSISGNPINFETVRIASRPACFQVGGLLSEAECDHLMNVGDAIGMKDAKTTLGDAATIRNCSHGIYAAKGDKVAESLIEAVKQLFVRPELFEPSDWSTGCRCEEVHVLKYKPNGEFRPHYDADAENLRVLTVLVYLNGVGETWFPLALRRRADAEEVANCNPTRELAHTTAHLSKAEKTGVKVSPRKGDAIAFYNFLDDGSGQSDNFALHAGLPAPAEKSVCAVFFRVDKRPKEGANHLQAIGALTAKGSPDGTRTTKGKASKTKRTKIKSR